METRDLGGHSMRFRPKSTSEGEARLPWTSLIDVVFLLLIYFMLTSQSTRESELSSALQAERRSGAGASNMQVQVVNVEQIEGVPGYRLGDRLMRTPAQLEAMLRQLPKDPGVFVRVAGDVPIEAAAGALQAAKDAGFTKVSYVPVSM